MSSEVIRGQQTMALRADPPARPVEHTKAWCNAAAPDPALDSNYRPPGQTLSSGVGSARVSSRSPRLPPPPVPLSGHHSSLNPPLPWSRSPLSYHPTSSPPKSIRGGSIPPLNHALRASSHGTFSENPASERSRSDIGCCCGHHEHKASCPQIAGPGRRRAAERRPGHLALYLRPGR